MARVDLRLLDQVLATHPDLATLLVTPTGQELMRGGPALGRHLIGAEEASDHWLVQFLENVAAEEMTLTRGLCKGHMMRTVTTTVSILRYLNDVFRRLSREADRRDEEDGEGQQEDACDNPEGGGLPPEIARCMDGDGEEDGEEGSGQGAGAEVDPGSMMDQAFEDLAEQGGAIDSLERLMPGLGWGYGRQHLESALLRDMGLFAELIGRAGELREIADELGRMEAAQRRRQPPRRGGREAVVGVRSGGELSDVLPVELALLGDSQTENLFYQRYIERRLLSLELEGTMEEETNQGRRGPVIACVDTSGSMAGQPEIVAKALVLAVMRRALPQGRRVRLMLFGGPGDFVDMDIGRSSQAMGQVLEFLGMGFRSGTDFDGPLERAIELLDTERYEQADILVVTDGYCSASAPIIARIDRLRDELGFEIASVVVGDHTQGVEPFSDRVWRVNAQQGAESIAIEEIVRRPDQ